MEVLKENLSSYPVIPLRDIVVFPGMVVFFFVGREKSINALESVMEENQRVLLLTQKNAEIETPNADDLYHIGVVAEVKQLLKLPDGTVKVLVEGIRRVQTKGLSDLSGAFHSSVIDIEDIIDESDVNLLVSALIEKFREYAKYNTSVTLLIKESTKAREYTSNLNFIKKIIYLKRDNKNDFHSGLSGFFNLKNEIKNNSFDKVFIFNSSIR